MKTDSEKIKEHFEKLGLPIIDYSVDSLIYAHATAHKELIELRKKQSNLHCFVLDNRERIRTSVYRKMLDILYGEQT